VPSEPQPTTFEKVIVDLSPEFVRIYAQALAAEAHNLSEIAGPGYRKALEFLVKDYAISVNPNETINIRKMLLGIVIANYIKYDKVATLAARAAWLGNDETHYERKWIDKDLQDFKKLIIATVHFISMDRLVTDLPTDMPKP
jgi:hypothetical protein